MSGLQSKLQALHLPPLRATVAALLLMGMSLSMTIRADGLLSKYTLRHWNVEDGLPEGLVLSIEQMADGFLWLTTPHYIVRFDGVNFVRFPQEQLAASPAAYFRQMHIDHRGTPWICGDETVLRFDGQIWQSVPLVGGTNSLGSPISRVTPDGETVMSGKLVFFCIGDVGGRLVVASTRGIHIFDGRQLVFVNHPDVHEDSPTLFTSAAIDSRGDVWLTEGERLLRFHDGVYGEESFPLELHATNFFKVVTAGPDVVWVQQVDGRIFRRAAEHWTEVLPAGLRISCVLESQEMNWIGSVEGLHRLQGGKWLALAEPGSYGPRDVRCLTLSRDGCLWIGTSSGFYRLQQRSVSMFKAGSDPGQLPVTALWPASTNEFWAGSRIGGLLAGSPGRFHHYTSTNMLKGVAVSALLQSSDKQLWVGTQGSHLLRLGTNGSLTQLRQKDGFKSRHITCLFEDSVHRIWVGTREGLLVRTGEDWLVESAGRLDTILAITEGSNGVIQVGTQSSGLWELPPSGGMLEHRSSEGLPSDTARLLLTDSDGILWIGTPSGLARWKGVQKTVFRTRQGLPDDDIRQLLDDGQGHLWLGTRHGLVRVSKREFEEVAAGEKDRLSFLLLGEDAGLTVGLNTGGNVPLSARGLDGRLWFCTQEGLAMVDSSTLPAHAQASEPRIEGLSTASGFTVSLRGLLSGNPVPARHPENGPILLPAGSVNVEFSYTLPSYTAPDHVLFQTWLEGYESAWSTPAPMRKVTYPRLTPGKYRFRLRASPGDGVWIESGQSLDFAVEALFYQTGWFKGLTGMAGMTCVGIASGQLVRRRARARLREVQRGQARELAVERERARIARDIHDDLGATLTQIAMLSESAQAEAKHAGSLKAKLGDIFKRAQGATRELDEIVWAIDPGNDSVEQVVIYLCQFAEEYLKLADLHFRLDAPQELPPIPLSSAQRHSLFLAAREALHNTVKHARATEVWLRIKLEGVNLHVLLEDNGQGCPRVAGGSGCGSANMSERMASIGGHFDRRERSGGGTVVEFILPLSGSISQPGKI